MDEIFLLKLSVVCVLVGLPLLFAVVYLGNVEEVPAGLIGAEYLGEKVSVIGKITNVAGNEKVSRITVQSEDSIVGITFNNLSVEKDQRIEMIGTVQRSAKGYELLIDKVYLR